MPFPCSSVGRLFNHSVKTTEGPRSQGPGTGEKGKQLKQASKGAIYPEWLPRGQLWSRRQESRAGPAPGRRTFFRGQTQANSVPPVHPHLLTEDTGGMEAPFSRTETEAIGPSFEVSLGRLVSYICIYIYANYMCPRGIAKG